MIKTSWERLRKFKVARAFLTYKILRGFSIRVGFPHKWALKIATWIWVRKKKESGIAIWMWVKRL